jgi:ribosomal protein S18 acetylase RimI-like enzyme
LVFIAHGRREVVHVKVTANPTAAWVWRQLIEATPWGHKPRHLLRDHDAVYGRDFRKRARRIGIDAIATPIHAPKANTIAERVIGTLRRECLDHVIVLDEHHLSTVLREFVVYYNRERPHRTLGLQIPEPCSRPTTGPIQSRPVLNGLHHPNVDDAAHLAFWVAVAGNGVVGTVGLRQVGEVSSVASDSAENSSMPGLQSWIESGTVGEVRRLRVAPEWRRCGLGTALMQELINSATFSFGLRRLVLNTTAAQIPALALYARLGFHELGRSYLGAYELVWLQRLLDGVSV